MSRMKLKTGDMVMVRTGKDAGKKGKITQVFPKEMRVVVDGVNSMTKNVRSKDGKEKGQRIQYFAPLHASNVMVLDPKTNTPTRIGAMTVGDKKIRRAVKSKEALS